ncbi:hypothetical protein CC2G_001730 [Coprinopsis cinerea AmutBmut pab1-1]|nr:hypothetical protein CC2G_001730 [Coprinopsis cinerea AmutBmut pab1-1]
MVRITTLVSFAAFVATLSPSIVAVPIQLDDDLVIREPHIVDSVVERGFDNVDLLECEPIFGHAAKDRCGFGGGAKGRRDFESLYDLLERDYDDIELLEREPIFGKNPTPFTHSV